MKCLRALLVAVAVAGCADSYVCHVAADMALAEKAVKCFVQSESRVPDSLEDVIRRPDCGLRRIPRDPRGQLLSIKRIGPSEWVIIAGNGNTRPHWLLCALGRSAFASLCFGVVGITVIIIGAVRRRLVLTLIGIALFVFAWAIAGYGRFT